MKANQTFSLPGSLYTFHIRFLVALSQSLSSNRHSTLIISLLQVFDALIFFPFLFHIFAKYDCNVHKIIIFDSGQQGNNAFNRPNERSRWVGRTVA